VSLTASPIPANLPSVHRSGNDRIPRPSRRRSPEAPARARQSPQDEGRKALLSAGIPAYSRPSRNNQDRPVTPEVAGSSPVAPVKIPANRQVVLSVQTPDRRQLHRPFRSKTRNGQKTARNQSPGCRVQADSGRVETVRQAACNYTKRPEVTAAPRPAIRMRLAGASAPGRISSWMRRRERQQPPACAPAAS
jgi:hypothetical protein